ncbi:Mitochondrial distribution and morphology protein 12 [Gryganskiella cystojenkinii]|nr:Mitochondrial distribution and morphology protein 12 [Gryganskiella cystojenkinii]
MSFVFSWDKLDDEVALQIEGMIHAHFQRITKPTFMGNIAVSKFRLGSTPPSITVLDVTDPLEEWYVHMDQEEARLAQEAADAGGGESMDEDDLASGEEDEDGYADEYSFSPDGSIVMVGEGEDMEYLHNGPFEGEEEEEEEFEDDQVRMGTESWLRRHHQRDNNGSTGTSSDSFKEEIQKVFMGGSRRSGPGSATSQTTQQNVREGLEVEVIPHGEPIHDFKSAVASPTKTSPSSTTSSSTTSSSSSENPSPYKTSAVPTPKMHLEEKARPSLVVTQPSSFAESSKQRHNRVPQLDIDTKSASPRNFATTSSPFNQRRPATSKSLSSHASDDDIESEAFYTQGESTIYQRLKNLALDSSTLHASSGATVPEKVPLDGNLSPQDYHSTPQNSFFPSTPGSGNGGNMQGTFGLGFGAGLGSGIGSSPGSVLSSVMQNRSSRPLSAASFYSTPTTPTAGTAATSVPSQTMPGQAPPFHLPDMSGMVSGNSLLGLGRMQLGSMYSSRAGTPSRTIPSTPRGFESPILAVSRRQSFSDGTGDDSLTGFTKESSHAIPHQHHRVDHNHDSAYTSPVEALSFDALRQPLPKSTAGAQQERRQSASRGQRSSDVTREKRVPQGYRRGGASKRRASSPPRPLQPKRHENDIQLLMDVSYQGQMGFTVETEMLLNYPTFAFLALPVKLVITGFSFKSKVLMGYLRDHVNVCFLEPEDPNDSILSDVRIESQVGDEQKQAVLKNVGKIERFVVEQLRKFITEDFVYPSYHSVELIRTPAAPAPGAETSSGTGVPTQPGMSSSHPGSSSSTLPATIAPSTAAGSTTSASTHRDLSQPGLHRRAGGGGSSIPSRGSTSSSATNTSRSAPSRTGVQGYGNPGSESPRQFANASLSSRQSARFS